MALDEAGMARLADRLRGLCDRITDRRVLVGLGGIAGSGKSTLATRLASLVPGVAVFGLDGFHLPNAVLHERGIYDRKGAPDTYDTENFIALLRRYRDLQVAGTYPIYDRANTHEPMTAPAPIDAEVRLILAEGQFMLLDQPPWDVLAEVFDETWWLDTPLDTAQQWIIARHTTTGRTPEQAVVKYENDRRNSELVLSQMREPDLRLCWPGTV